METIILHVEGMSCSHCVNAITKSLEALDGVDSVQVNLERKTVTAAYDAARVSSDDMKQEIEEQGYDVV